MNRTRPARNVRITLVVAALLHVLGGDFGAWLHAYYAPAAELAVAAAAGGEREKAPAPAHPSDCAVCQTVGDGTPAPPAAGTLFRAPTASFAQGAEPDAPAPRWRPATPSLPRGPPHRS
jgi:hypothetical protein